MDELLPQDEPDINGGLKVVSYSSDDQGACCRHQAFGWQPVNIVNRQAWQEIDKMVASSREKVATGTVSCLHYYMTVNQMTPSLLARYTDQPFWLVHLHLRPLFYKRLGVKTLQKYAELFQVSVVDLENGVLQAPVYERR